LDGTVKRVLDHDTFTGKDLTGAGQYSQVPAMVDFGPQFSVFDGKIWQKLYLDVRPINQTGTKDVNVVFGITGELDAARLQQDVFLVSFHGMTAEVWGDYSNINNVEFQMTVTYLDGSTALLRFTVDHQISEVPAGLGWDAIELPEDIILTLDGTKQFRTTQNFNLTLLCAGLQT
jgi:hypothetical protein